MSINLCWWWMLSHCWGCSHRHWKTVSSFPWQSFQCNEEKSWGSDKYFEFPLSAYPQIENNLQLQECLIYRSLVYDHHPWLQYLPRTWRMRTGMMDKDEILIIYHSHSIAASWHRSQHSVPNLHTHIDIELLILIVIWSCYRFVYSLSQICVLKDFTAIFMMIGTLLLNFCLFRPYQKIWCKRPTTTLLNSPFGECCWYILMDPIFL